MSRQPYSFFACDRCGAAVGEPCIAKSGDRARYAHQVRYQAAAEVIDASGVYDDYFALANVIRDLRTRLIEIRTTVNTHGANINHMWVQSKIKDAINASH